MPNHLGGMKPESGEMFPSVGFKRELALWGDKGDERASFAGAEDAADACDGDSSDGLRDAGRGWGGEEKLVVLSAVQGLLLGGAGADRQASGIDLGGDGRLGAEMGEVGGEAVAEVDGCRGQTAAKQRLSDFEAGLRE